jgi:hypothetical protein
MATRKTLYVLCRNGHWFSGDACPIDGYRDEFTSRVRTSERALSASGEPVELSQVIRAAKIEGREAVRIMLVESAAVDQTENVGCFVELD